MRAINFLILLVFMSISGVEEHPEKQSEVKTEISQTPVWEREHGSRGALLLKKFKSLKEFEKVVKIEYKKGFKPLVQLTHEIEGRKVIGELKKGVSELDFMKAKDGGFWDRVNIVFKSPYGVFQRNDFRKVYALSRRRPQIFGEGDPAFYDLAKMMVKNIDSEDKAIMSSEELGEKGYLNTFNHITSQAFLTSVFSEKMADFLADIHERRNLPELVTGDFTIEQIADLETGPTDNFLDIINNEWGQELGKKLAKEYQITQETNWTPVFLAEYLNDIQNYYSWAFELGFEPFKSTDRLVIQFSNKINQVMKEGTVVR